MPSSIYHNHHIVPKHAGGSDNPDNLVRVTIPEHAERHRLLYEQYGRLGDKVAWLMMSGKTNEGETLRYKLAHTPEANAKRSAKMLGRTLTAEHCDKIGAFNKGKVYGTETRNKIGAASKVVWSRTGYRDKMSAVHIGKHPSEETRNKQRMSQRARRQKERYSSVLL